MHFNSLKKSSCSPDVHTQVNNVLGGSPTTDAIKIPTTNSNLPHVTCSSDSVMGTVLNVTLYETDNWRCRSPANWDESNKCELCNIGFDLESYGTEMMQSLDSSQYILQLTDPSFYKLVVFSFYNAYLLHFVRLTWVPMYGWRLITLARATCCFLGQPLAV